MNSGHVYGAVHEDEGRLAMETTFQKHRKYPRHKTPKGTWVGWNSAGHRGVARAEVAGMGGLFLHTPNPLPLGTVIELLLDLKTGEVRARAIVRDSAPGQGMGCNSCKCSLPTGPG